MMKNLGQYNIFDFESFSKGKAFEVVNCSPWVERATSKLLGTVVEVVIIKDETNYGEGKGKGLNKYEKLKFKIQDAKAPGKMRQLPDVIYARYNTEIGMGNQIPLWLLGFLY